jgi:phospholipase/carboxylesterase
MPLVSLRNYVSLAVRGPAADRRGFGWPETADSIVTAEARIADAVSQARQKFNVHRDRIFLAGFGTGGTMALRLALRRPDRYAGAASLAGQFPAGHAPLSRLAAIRRSRLLIMHCRDSQAYPVDRVCQELALFHAAGLSVTLRQYPCGDELTTQMLSDLDVWVMEQVTGVPAASEPAPLPSEWN